MLVLTRKLGEQILIDGGIAITLLEIRSGQVKIGLEAPVNVKIHRREIAARIARAQEQAGHGR